MYLKMNDAQSYGRGISLGSINHDNLKSFSLFLKRLGPHGYRDWPEDVDELKEAIKNEHFFDCHYLNALYEHDEIMGYYWVKPESQINRAIIGARGKYYGSLLGTAIELARALLIEGCVSAFRTHEVNDKKEMKAFGFKTEKVYQIMKCASPVVSHDVRLPPDYTLRNLSGLEEADKLCAIQNTVFSNHYGYEPNTLDSIKKQLVQKGAGCENVFLIEDPNKHVVAYCWNIIKSKGNRRLGKISMLGALPNHRGKGLGRIVSSAAITNLIRRGIKEFELEVDADNLSAKKIYTQLGFKVVDHIEWMKKEFDS